MNIMETEGRENRDWLAASKVAEKTGKDNDKFFVLCFATKKLLMTLARIRYGSYK